MNKLFYIIGWIFSIGFVTAIFFMGGSKLTIVDIIVTLTFGWLVAPIKHPCNYSGYKHWWADRKNWFKT